MFTVGELAKLTGITVRTLHHYDEIGLVVPSERTVAGYRLYGDADVVRLHHVLLLREIGMPRRSWLDAPGSTRCSPPWKPWKPTQKEIRCSPTT